MNDSDLLLTAQQYDLLTVDKPEKSRKPQPCAGLVNELRETFPYASERVLWTVGRKLHDSVGSELGKRGLIALSSLTGWLQFVRLHEVNLMTLVSRIEQASVAMDDHIRENADIRVEMKRRQKYLDDTQLEISKFLQFVHGNHPALRKQIKSAMEMIIKAAFQSVPDEPERGLPLALEAIVVARKDYRRLDNIRNNYRVPKETANWIIQIVVRLSTEGDKR
jgi:hypothetical protein